MTPAVIRLIPQDKEIYMQKGHLVVQRVALFLCKISAVSGQKAEQPATTACLLAVLLINMHLSGWSNGGQHA